MRRVLSFIVIGIFVLTLGGCATARKQKDLEIQGLRNQISVLEAQLQSKDEEIDSLHQSLRSATEIQTEAAVTKKKTIPEVKSRPKVKDIQLALRNAGYDPGPVDGRMGRKTREAIRAFQRANNLSADGRVGKDTWAMLKEYLYKKVK